MKALFLFLKNFLGKYKNNEKTTEYSEKTLQLFEEKRLVKIQKELLRAQREQFERQFAAMQTARQNALRNGGVPIG